MEVEIYRFPKDQRYDRLSEISEISWQIFNNLFSVHRAQSSRFLIHRLIETSIQFPHHSFVFTPVDRIKIAITGAWCHDAKLNYRRANRRNRFHSISTLHPVPNCFILTNHPAPREIDWRESIDCDISINLDTRRASDFGFPTSLPLSPFTRLENWIGFGEESRRYMSSLARRRYNSDTILLPRKKRDEEKREKLI